MLIHVRSLVIFILIFVLVALSSLIAHIFVQKQSTPISQEHFKNTSSFDDNTNIFIINLARNRQRCFGLIEHLSMPHFITIVNAVDGKLLQNKPKNTNLRYGEIGCFASHMKIIDRIVEYKMPMALILEDDTRIKLPDELDVLNTYLDQTPVNWDILTFSDGANKEVKQQISDKIIIPQKGLWNAHIYLISLSGAQKLKTLFAKTGYSAPYDVWAYSAPNVNIYSSSDSPFNRAQLGSDTLVPDH